jgi:hypothetical protein
VRLPMMAGILGTVVATALGIIEKPTRIDLTTYTIAMLWLSVVGFIGFVLHLNSNLVAQGTIVIECILRVSPTLAPLLFANIGLLGLLTHLDPAEPTK